MDNDDFIGSIDTIEEPKKTKRQEGYQSAEQSDSRNESAPQLTKRQEQYDKIALVKIDGTAITESGELVSHNWFKRLKLDPEKYGDIYLTPKEARALKASHERMKTGAAASTPMLCLGEDRCPMAQLCPYVAIEVDARKRGETRNVVPVGKPCQPPGTMIRVVGYEKVPIESLDPEKHKVWTWFRKQDLLRSGKGSSFTLHERDYHGPLIKLETASHSHEVTLEHISIVKFNENAIRKPCVYLMRKGDFWRVGMTKLINLYDSPKSRVKSLFGPGQRAAKEGADELWILATCETVAEAHLLEEAFSIYIGASKCGFADSLHKTKSKHNGLYKWVTEEQLLAHHNMLKKPYGHYKAFLASQGLSIEAPFWSKENPLVLGRSRGICLSMPFAIHSCNILNDVMKVAVVKEEPGKATRSRFVTNWQNVKTSSREYHGSVYSLDVHINKTYIANEIVTHNCPVEQDVLHYTVAKYAQEFGIGDTPEDFTDQRIILQLAECELLDARMNAVLATKYPDLTEEKVAAVIGSEFGTEDHLVKDIADALKIKEKLQNRMERLRKVLVATREGKYKRDAALDTSSTNDLSNTHAKILETLATLRRKVEDE